MVEGDVLYLWLARTPQSVTLIPVGGKIKQGTGPGPDSPRSISASVPGNRSTLLVELRTLFQPVFLLSP